MKFLRYLILFLFILNISGAINHYMGEGALSSGISYLSYLLLVLYYVLTNEKGTFNKWMILIGVLYFVIGLLQYVGELSYFVTWSIKFFIVIICGYSLVKKTTEIEFFVFLLLGALTILLHATVIPGGSAEYGRFSGFYVNPNGASFICGSGYALTFAIKNKRLRLIGQLVFTFMGLLTLSRTFIGSWLILNLISVKIDVKNIRVFFLGFGVLLLLLLMSEQFEVKNARIDQLKRIANNEKVEAEEINEGSRTETWAKFYEDLMEHPILGTGYYTFQGGTEKHPLGVHNTFLLILGESGIVPFLVFVIFYLYLLASSIKLFGVAPNLLMQILVLVLFLNVAHIYFTHHFILFISLWIQNQVKEKKLLLQ